MEPNTQDPIEYLFEFSRSFDSFILVAGPLVLIILMAAVLAFFVIKRRKRANEMLTVSEDEILTFETGETPASELPESSQNPSLSTLEEDKNISEAASKQSDTTMIPLDDSGWLIRLRTGLSKTRATWFENLSSLFSGKDQIDAQTLEKLHEILYRADVGVKAADKLVDRVKSALADRKDVHLNDVLAILREEILSIFRGSERKMHAPEAGPTVILIAGVNGVGKTTTIGKLAAHFVAQEKKVILCAADTFRAAAIDQLKVWGERTGSPVIAHQQGSDPAAVAYDAVRAAVARDVDILLIDTAGRLHNKDDLMAELAKVKRVIGKDLPGAPHETWLVVDATTGQNANLQVKAFTEIADVTGLVVTKLDGTAKGGVVIGIVEQHQLPIFFIGVGEKVNDLRNFQASDFASSLLPES
jgi:fused signal recognition particle receptor